MIFNHKLFIGFNPAVSKNLMSIKLSMVMDQEVPTRPDWTWGRKSHIDRCKEINIIVICESLKNSRIFSFIFTKLKLYIYLYKTL